MCCSGAERCACMYATLVVKYSLKAEQEPLHSNNISCNKLLSESYFNHCICTYPYVGYWVKTPTSATKIQHKTIYVQMRTDQCCSTQWAVGDVTVDMSDVLWVLLHKYKALPLLSSIGWSNHQSQFNPSQFYQSPVWCVESNNKSDQHSPVSRG